MSSTGSDSRIDILGGVLGFLKRSTQEYVLLSESNIVMNHTFNEMFDRHVKTNADITVACQQVNEFEPSEEYEAFVYEDEQHNITGIDRGSNIGGAKLKHCGYILINKQVLINIIEESKIRGKKGYLMNIVTRNIGKLNIKTFKLDCYAKKVSTLNEYKQVNMEILNKEVC